MPALTELVLFNNSLQGPLHDWDPRHCLGFKHPSTCSHCASTTMQRIGHWCKCRGNLAATMNSSI